MSSVCAAATDMRPNRAVAMAQLAQVFISEFFDQNPLSQMSVVVMRQGCAHVLTDLSASPELHRNAIKSALETGGEVSLQNMLTQCIQVRPRMQLSAAPDACSTNACLTGGSAKAALYS